MPIIHTGWFTCCEHVYYEARSFRCGSLCGTPDVSAHLKTEPEKQDFVDMISSQHPLTNSDMKRYHTLLAGASWMAEYGNPDTSDWDYLQKYSPYHSKSSFKELRW